MSIGTRRMGIMRCRFESWVIVGLVLVGCVLGVEGRILSDEVNSEKRYVTVSGRLLGERQLIFAASGYEDKAKPGDGPGPGHGQWNGPVSGGGGSMGGPIGGGGGGVGYGNDHGKGQSGGGGGYGGGGGFGYGGGGGDGGYGHHGPGSMSKSQLGLVIGNKKKQ